MAKNIEIINFAVELIIKAAILAAMILWKSPEKKPENVNGGRDFE